MANSFLKGEEEIITERKFPLEVYFCESCSLVQLLDVINPEVLFRDYIYVTGTSTTMAEHYRTYARQVVERLQIKNGNLVVEIASNDGSLLKCFQPYGVKVLGVEPASNIARLANQSGVATENLFFNLRTAEEIHTKYGSARAVIGNNVLAHVDDPWDFLSGFKRLLTRDGLVIIEVPYLRELIDRLEYDTIYHEHLSYFSITSLARLFEEVGLSILQIEPVTVHGGSLRIYAGLEDYYGKHSETVLRQVEIECQDGLKSLEYYLKFAVQVDANRQILVELLKDLHTQGKTIAGYGAPAKGNTLLNYCQISIELLPYTVDKNPLKVGKFSPGMHIPVLPVDTLLERQPDYILIMAWNFAEEIMQQQETYRQRGGQFIIPLPYPKVIQ